LMLPVAWTDRGPVGTSTPLTYEVLVELAEVITAVGSHHTGVISHHTG
jgi:hypothetical protein